MVERLHHHLLYNFSWNQIIPLSKFYGLLDNWPIFHVSFQIHEDVGSAWLLHTIDT